MDSSSTVTSSSVSLASSSSSSSFNDTSIINRNSTSIVVGIDGISRMPLHKSYSTSADDESKIDDTIELLDMNQLTKRVIDIASSNTEPLKKPVTIYMMPNQCMAMILFLFFLMENCANVDDAGKINPFLILN